MAQPHYDGAGLVCEALIDHQVTTLFGYSGGAILPFYDALSRYPALHHVMVRHEQAAAHAAAGYARACGRPGVCVTTSGPGATNLLTGIMDARLDSTPMIVLGGQVPTQLIGSDAFQETDMMCMTASITKHNFQPRSVDELQEVMHAAFHIASSGRPGPVYIDLPSDVLKAKARKRNDITLDLPGYPVALAPEPEQVQAAAKALRQAKRPLLVVGGGAVHAEAGAALLKLAEHLHCPVVSTIMGKGVVSEDHPLVLGPLGMYGRKSAVHAVMECDVMVAMGCRFSDRITGKVDAFAQKKQIIHVDVDPYEIGKNVATELGIMGDVQQTTLALHAALTDFEPSSAQRQWRAKLGAAREVCERCVPHEAPVGVHPKAVMDAINRAKGPADIVTTGVGQHQMFATHFLQHQQPRTLVTSGGAGTMGYGLPAALGTMFACPDARTFVVDGDGSFQMNVQELATVAQENLRPIIIVLDNFHLGMVRQWQDRVYDGRHQAVWFDAKAGHPDLVMLTQAFGLEAHNVATEAELETALQAALQSNKGTLLRVLVDPNIDMLPMMPSGSTFQEFYGNCVPAPGQLFSDDELREMAQAAKQKNKG